MPDYVLLAAAVEDPTTIVGRPPMSTLAWGDRLGDLGGTLTWTAPARHTDLAGLEPEDIVVWLERDGTLVSAGWLRTIAVDPTSEVATLSCTGLMTYMRKRTVGEIDEASIDVLALARKLVDDAQGLNAAASIGITTGTETAGRTRAYTARTRDRLNVGETFVALAEQDGWEWRTDHAWISGTPTATLRLRGDRLGRSTTFAVEHGASIDLTSAEQDGTDRASTVVAVGSGQTDSPLSATAAGTPTGLLTEATVTVDTDNATVLQQVADAALGSLTAPVTRIAGRLRPGSDLRIGAFLLGDRVRVRADLGVITVDGDYRITEYSVQVDSSGTETVDVGFAPIGAWT